MYLLNVFNCTNRIILSQIWKVKMKKRYDNHTQQTMRLRLGPLLLTWFNSTGRVITIPKLQRLLRSRSMLG